MIVYRSRKNNVDKIIETFKDKEIFVFVEIQEKNKSIEKMGFNNIDEKEYIIPKRANRYAKINADGYEIIDKNAPKEKFEQIRFVTQRRWAGRGKTKDVEVMISFERERYKRIQILPYSVLFAIIEKNNKKYVTSESMLCNEKNKERIKNTINLILEIFHKCQIDIDVKEFIKNKKIKRLEWEVLPKGKYPWEKIKKYIRRNKENITYKKLEEERMEYFNSLNPDFYAIGKEGFQGYVIIGFENAKKYFLENSDYGNAIYVLNKKWEEISKLTKKEALNDKNFKRRIVHYKNWQAEVKKELANFVIC